MRPINRPQLLIASIIATSCVTFAAEKPASTPPPPAPTVKQLRRAEVSGILEREPVKLNDGVYEGAPFVAGGAERPRVALLDGWAAAGNVDDKPGDERVALLAASSGGTGTSLYLAVFAMRDRRLTNLGTVRVGDRVVPRGVAIDGRAIELDVVEGDDGDPLCCPTRSVRRSYRLESGGLRQLADVSFELVHSQIVLSVTVGRVDGLHVLLDTGTDPSVIDLETAARLGLPVAAEASGEAEGAGDGSNPVHPAKIAGLRIGSEEIPPIDAVAMDLSAASRRLGVEIAGILGHSFLNGRIVENDYPRRLLRLLPEAPVYARTAVVAPLETESHARSPLLTQLVRVNGKPLPVTLDTGSSFNLELFPKARTLLGPALWDTHGRVGHVVGARGNASVRHVDADSIEIGGLALDSRDLVLSAGAEETGPRVGNLGNEGLGSFVLTLDYRNGQIAFAKRSLAP
jgi:predicted aspartyl protease